MTFKATTIAAAVSMLLTMAGATAAAAGPDAPARQSAAAIDAIYSFDIPAQELSSALRSFASISRQQVAFDTQTIQGKRNAPLKGSYTADAALSHLLDGSGLVAERGDSGVFIVRDRSSPSFAPTANVRSDAGVRLAQVDRAQAGTETSNAQSAQGAASSDEVEEIVVTAQKRAERLVETPLSVSVIQADTLARSGATQFRDFADTVPGLNFKSIGAGVSQVSIRGVTTGFDPGPTVAIYIDDVPYGSSSAFADGSQRALDLALFDLDHVEVLRGPQGTLYGASAIGGLVKYVTQAPATAAFNGSVRTGLSFTRDGGISYNAALALNAPLVADKVALRASGFYSHDGGFIDNVTLDRKDVDRSKVYGGRLDLLMTPNDALEIRIAALLQNISRDGEPTASFTLAGDAIDGRLDQRRVTPEPFDQRFRLVSGTVTYDLGEATVTSISSYQTSRIEAFFDATEVYAGFCQFQGDVCSAAGVPSDSDTDKFAQELRFASANNDSVEWMLGAFYTHESSQRDLAFALRDLAGEPLPNALYDLSAPSTYEEYAAFGDLTYHFNDRFDVTGGVRYARNKQSYTQNASGAFIGPLPTNRTNEDVFTYLGNARYHFAERTIGYLRYATGYQPGGPNLVPRDPVTGASLAPDSFDPGRLSSYEAGFKHETSDRRFGIDLATYYIDWSELQVLASVNNIGYFATAPGGATVKGLELSLTASPVDALALSAALAWQDAKMSKTDPSLQADKGERLPGVPRRTATLNADYALPFSAQWKPSLGATLRYVSDRESSFDSSVTFPDYHLPSYTTVDLRAGIRASDIEWQLYVRNAFDERAQLSTYTQFGSPRVAIVPPRTIGLSLLKSF